MSPSPKKIALCLTGGGVTGGLFQVGAVAALEDSFEGLSFDMYLGTSTGATTAAALAGGVGVRRMYRALLDPADNYFPIERWHIVNLDLDEWRRTILSAISALRHGFASLVAHTPTPAPKDFWEQLDRFYDALPSGLFSLNRFETFLADFFLRRAIPNSFRALPKQLLVPAYDLDAGELVLFGSPGFDHVPVTLACAATMALPPFFSPVRIGGRFYIDGGVGRSCEIDAVVERHAQLVVIINPSVPIRSTASAAGIPTGYGTGSSLRDKGLMWVHNQACRTGVHARLHDAIDRCERDHSAEVLLLEPDPGDAVRFFHNAASFGARRDILEWAYRTTKAHLSRWIAERPESLAEFGLRPIASDEPSASTPPVAVD